MDSARTALFVIDIQNELAVDEATRVPNSARVLASAEAILTAARLSVVDPARARGVPSPSLIVFVQHEEFADKGGTMVRGTGPWELVFRPRAGVEEEMLVEKHTGDTFESNPDLASRLRTAGVQRIVVFGLQSECCVELTSRGALAAGFAVTVLSGAHSTYDDGGKTATQIETEVDERLRQLGAEVIPWEVAVNRWAERGQIC